MSTHTKIICDVKNCGDEATHKQKTVSVVFTTEQNEGRATTPYLSGEELDFCDKHYQRYIDTLTFRATGAMGYNDYEFQDEL